MTLGAASDEGDGDTENTVLGSGLPALSPLHSNDRFPGGFDDSEAHTVILSRTGPHHGDGPAANVEPAMLPLNREQGYTRARFAIRIGTHEPIPLGVPAHIGRRPSAPRIAGPRTPRLVVVPSPTGEVSSTHVEILQEADTVVVTDLGSTNGTTVTLAGFAPRTLRQGESLVVGAGTIVDIGDGIRILIVTLPDNAATEGTQ